MQPDASPDGIVTPNSPGRELRPRICLRDDILRACCFASIVFVCSLSCLLVWDSYRWTQVTAAKTECQIADSMAGDIRPDSDSLRATISRSAGASRVPLIWPASGELREDAVLNAGGGLTDYSTSFLITADGCPRRLANGQPPRTVNPGDLADFRFRRTQRDPDGRILGPGFRQVLNASHASTAVLQPRKRLAAYRSAAGFPLAVGYEQAMQEINADWLGIFLIIAGTAVAVGSLLFFFMRVIGRERQRQEAARRSALLRVEALSQANKDLEAKISREIQSRKEVQEKLAKSQRLETLGQLAGGIAHDINNVLQTVSGACSLVQQHDPENGDVQRLTAIALSATDRGRAVTQRLLLFARDSAIKAEESVDIAEVLHDLRDLLNHTLCDNVALELDLAEDLPDIWADRMQLETVIINLATNARDAMPDGGIITLRARVETVAKTAAETADLSPGRYVHLSVTDTGVGMDATIMSRATEPFFSTKSAGKGTGLGLSMARGFAEQSNGKLEIVSKVGHGTTIDIWVPAEPNARRVNRGMLDRAPLQRGGDTSIRILIVDDNTPARELTGEGLADAGLEVHEAESGVAALAAVRGGLEIDFLLTDLSMPEMDGLQLIDAIRTILPELPAILLTGNTGAVADLATDHPADAFCMVLQKPIRMQVLLDHIQNLVRRTNAPSMTG